MASKGTAILWVWQKWSSLRMEGDYCGGHIYLGISESQKCVLEKFYKLIGVSVSFTFSVSFIFCVNIFFLYHCLIICNARS